MSSKQVLVMRKMPKGQRTGKYCAQAAHASMGALFSIAHIDNDKMVIPLDNEFVKDWVTGMFKKITLSVDNDAELEALYSRAVAAGLPCAIIKDSGLTEYNGVPTLTAVGIGPADSASIDAITGNLPLF